MIDYDRLEQLYVRDKSSMMEISEILHCSPHQVIYWMNRYKIPRRTIGEAVYLRNHPDGDPFMVKDIVSKADTWLLGMGLGLYWGEGNKANRHSVRLGNTDPALLNMFIRFLTELFGVDKRDLRFGLQIFTDIDSDEAMAYWTHILEVDAAQFYKITTTISGSIGNYRNKSLYGVITVHYHNKKLRDIIVGMLPR